MAKQILPLYTQLLQNNNFLDWTKLKAFADEIKMFVFDRVENIQGKGENAGYQDFLLLYNIQDCVVKSFENIVGKEKMLITSIISFPTIFSKAFYF